MARHKAWKAKLVTNFYGKNRHAKSPSLFGDLFNQPNVPFPSLPETDNCSDFSVESSEDVPDVDEALALNTQDTSACYNLFNHLQKGLVNWLQKCTVRNCATATS